MPINTVTVLTQGTNNNDLAAYSTASITPAANALLFFVVGSGSSGGLATAPTSMTDTLGLTWTLVDREVWGNTNGWLSIYVATTTSAPGSGTLTVNFSAAQGTFEWQVIQMLGAAATNPVVQTLGVVTANSTTKTVTLPSNVTSGNSVFAFGFQNNSAAITVGSGYTAIGTQQSGSAPVTRLASQYAIVGTRTTTMTGSNTNFALISVEVEAAVVTVTTFTGWGIPI